jgi:uncharacterized membrane protein YidH (DUF202 family)
MTAIGVAQQIVSSSGVAAEGLCALSFFVTGNARRLPFVVSFLAYQCMTDALLLVMEPRFNIWPALVATTYLGYLMEALAISELVYRLFSNSGTKVTPLQKWVIGFCVVFFAIASSGMTYLRSYSDFGSAQQRFLHIDQGVSIYRVLVFLVILLFLRSRASGNNTLVARVILAFATYAFCGLLSQVLGEAAPMLALPAGTFEWTNCACGFVWVLLLIALSWQVLHCPVARSKLEQAIKA